MHFTIMIDIMQPGSKTKIHSLIVPPAARNL
jgi:hypothetical protein